MISSKLLRIESTFWRAPSNQYPDQPLNNKYAELFSIPFPAPNSTKVAVVQLIREKISAMIPSSPFWENTWPSYRLSFLGSLYRELASSVVRKCSWLMRSWRSAVARVRRMSLRVAKICFRIGSRVRNRFIAAELCLFCPRHATQVSHMSLAPSFHRVCDEFLADHQESLRVVHTLEISQNTHAKKLKPVHDGRGHAP